MFHVCSHGPEAPARQIGGEIMEHEGAVRTQARTGEAAYPCAGDRTGLGPWVAGFLRDATDSALKEMWCLGTDHIDDHRGDGPIDTARRLVAAIERELRRRANERLILH